MVRMPVGVHISATWQIWLNHPCVAAMRPYVKLLWPLVIILISCVHCVCGAVVSAQHTELGLEERWQCRLFGRTQTWLHSSELSGARLLHADGKSLHDEIIQRGKWVLVASLIRLLFRPFIVRSSSWKVALDWLIDWYLIKHVTNVHVTVETEKCIHTYNGKNEHKKGF